jgi:indolepyruvate ferredoxin oxidoreductase beta subunit
VNAQGRPITILIAALGGEGGGVLTNWIINAAAEMGFTAQSTSIPGVAQRTGATTYYIEIVPLTERELKGKRPILALTPGIGDIDIMIASEFMEAGRAIASGFVTADRTLLIGSNSRFYVMNEKTAMGDGRYDQKRLSDAIDANAQQKIVFDMDAAAKQSGAMINAVMLGAIAGCGRLPIPEQVFEAAIRADGKAVDGNLRGFRAGLKQAQAKPKVAAKSSGKRAHGPVHDIEAMEGEIRAQMPQAARDVVLEGARRVVLYQDADYTRLYLDRLAPVARADEQANGNGTLLRETARHLAVRMTYEDVIRVAEAKIDPQRMRRIVEELAVKPGEPFKVVEFLKPGIEEFCQVLPPSLARRIIAFSEKRGWLDRSYKAMEVNTTSIRGYLKFWMLAKLRRFRRGTYRYQQEQAAIEAWLDLIVAAARRSGELAMEIAECARLIKGYGSTHKRGTENYRLIESQVIRPVLDGRLPVAQGIDAIASARTAALIDPEGESLQRSLAAIDRRAIPLAAE